MNLFDGFNLNKERSFFICSYNENKRLFEIIFSKDGEPNESSIEFSDEEIKQLSRYSNLTLIHTHTNSSAPTDNDFILFLKHNSIRNIIVLNPVGRYYYAAKTDPKIYSFNFKQIEEHIKELYKHTITNFGFINPEKYKNIHADAKIQSKYMLDVTEYFFSTVCKGLRQYVNIEYYPKEEL